MKSILKKSVALLLALIFSMSGILAVSASALSIIDEVKNAIQSSIVGEGEDPVNPENSEDPADPENPEDPADPENPEGPEEPEEPEEPVQPKTSITVTADKTVIEEGKTANLSGDVDGIYWFSEDTDIAYVNSSTGVVTAKSQGRVTITAAATVGGIQIYGNIEIIVTIKRTAIFNYLSNHNILSYQYRYEDNYFYTNPDSAWQHNFGYSALYDLAAPYLFMEYDYVRVHFEYQGEDWMIQLWKGQYGLVFYGCETGVYYKDHSDSEDTALTFYKCADEGRRLMIQTSLYHDKSLLRTGDYELEFESPYESTWWSTGFKPGHLNIEEPANELRQTGTITFKDEEMTAAFVEAFKNCEFTQVNSEKEMNIDSFWVEGNSVHYSWQEISSAENTMGVKIAGGTLIAMNILAILFAILMFFGIAMGGLLIFIII